MNLAEQCRGIWRRISRPALTIVLASYCVAALVTFSPPSAMTNALCLLVKPMMAYLGLYQNFWAFAPEPPKRNQTLSAVIALADGSTKTWRCPSLSDDRTRWHYVLWQLHCWRIPNHQEFWPDAAKYLAWHYRNPQNEPVLVTLFAEFDPIAPLDAAPGSAVSLTPTKVELLKYKVETGDLQ